MLTFLAALAVCALVAAPLLAGEYRRRRPFPGPPAAPNPWPAVPAVAAGPRLYDHARVTA